MAYKLAPSILSADFTALGKGIELINNSEADWIHVDVMDGVFVPNLTFGFPVIASIKKIAKKPLDVHLMIVQPERYITHFKEAGADILSVHYEACAHLHRTIGSIKEAGMQASVALNPHTPITLLKDIISDLDVVIVMSVNPGFAAQKFIQNTYAKVSELKELITKSNSKTLIEVDGGVSLENTEALLKAGADVLVAGNAVFNTQYPMDTIRRFKALG